MAYYTLLGYAVLLIALILGILARLAVNKDEPPYGEADRSTYTVAAVVIIIVLGAIGFALLLVL